MSKTGHVQLHSMNKAWNQSQIKTVKFVWSAGANIDIQEFGDRSREYTIN